MLFGQGQALQFLVGGSFAGDKLRDVELASSNQWARMLPREAAWGCADVRPVDCQTYESQSSLRYGEIRPHWTCWPCTQCCGQAALLCIMGTEQALGSAGVWAAPCQATLHLCWPLKLSYCFRTSLPSQACSTTAFLTEFLCTQRGNIPNMLLHKLDTGKWAHVYTGGAGFLPELASWYCWCSWCLRSRNCLHSTNPQDSCPSGWPDACSSCWEWWEGRKGERAEKISKLYTDMFSVQ